MTLPGELSVRPRLVDEVGVHTSEANVSIGIVIVVIVLSLCARAARRRSVRSARPRSGWSPSGSGSKKLADDNPIAFHGEAGYQAELLMPGLRFKLWPIFGVKKFPWVQVPAGEIGVVIAQVGAPLPIGAKSGVYKPEFGNFSDLDDVHRPTAGRRACSARCCLRARCCRSTRSRSWSSRRARSTACRCRPSSSSARAATGGVLRAGVVRAHAGAAAASS